MPHHFRKTPSSRRAASLTAKWVVPGPTVAAEIKYGRRTTHIIPCKPSHHRRRFHEGQRLSVKSYVGGPTECHVTVVSALRVRLGDVDYPVARELGYVRLDDFRLAWVAEHDPALRATCSSGSIVGTRTRRYGCSGSRGAGAPAPAPRGTLRRAVRREPRQGARRRTRGAHRERLEAPHRR
jgi:hypothetical protein